MQSHDGPVRRADPEAAIRASREREIVGSARKCGPGQRRDAKAVEAGTGTDPDDPHAIFEQSRGVIRGEPILLRESLGRSRGERSLRPCDAMDTLPWCAEPECATTIEQERGRAHPAVALRLDQFTVRCDDGTHRTIAAFGNPQRAIRGLRKPCGPTCVDLDLLKAI